MAHIQHSRVFTCCIAFVVCVCECKREDLSDCICEVIQSEKGPIWGFLAAEVLNRWLMRRWWPLLELAACLVCCCKGGCSPCFKEPAWKYACGKAELPKGLKFGFFLSTVCVWYSDASAFVDGIWCVVETWYWWGVNKKKEFLLEEALFKK